MSVEGTAIQRLSQIPTRQLGEGAILLKVGSYAPPHLGHIAAMSAALAALEGNNHNTAGVVFVPNGDAHVAHKINDTEGRWNFDERVRLFISRRAPWSIPTFVDDICGLRPVADPHITTTAIRTASQQLRVSPQRFVIVVGSDQVASIEPYLEANTAVCVIRPGADQALQAVQGQQWFREARANGRCLLAQGSVEISSTQLRAAQQRGRQE